VLLILIALGYLGAAACYSQYIGIFVQYQRIGCPSCPYVDVNGGGFITFFWLTAYYGTMNAFLLVFPCLAFMAYRAWTLTLRHELPGWQAAIGLAAIVLTFLGWLNLYPLSFLVWRVAPSLELLLRSSLVPAICLGTVSSMALRGKPRVYLVLSGLAMLALCRFMYGLSLSISPVFPITGS